MNKFKILFKTISLIDKCSNKRNKIFGNCSTCNRYNTSEAWCQSCDSRLLTQGWTSGNERLDEIIKSKQIHVTKYNSNCYLQWVRYEDFKDIEKIGEGGFATIYKATWINGYKYIDYETAKRSIKDKIVVLKKLHDSHNISNKFLSEFKSYINFNMGLYIIHIYGLTQDPITKEYILIMQYAENGNLQNYLSNNFKNLKWKTKIGILFDIIDGLKVIHQKKVPHRNFHSGNILQEKGVDNCSYIADLGFSHPANEPSLSPNKHSIFGILPYVAPEVLNGKPYTMTSDIYSFGVLMSVVSTGRQPFGHLAHNSDLAFSICKGLRPGFSINTPKFYIKLAHQCMDANPDKRPTAEKLVKIINFWHYSLSSDDISLLNSYSKDKVEAKSIKNTFDEMNQVEYDPSTITTTPHPDAIYISRLLKFTNLPQPINSKKTTIISNHNGHRQVDIPEEFPNQID